MHALTRLCLYEHEKNWLKSLFFFHSHQNGLLRSKSGKQVLYPFMLSTVGAKRKSQNKENSVTKPDNHTVNHEIMSRTMSETLI